MFDHLERPARPLPRFRQVLADLSPTTIAGGFIGIMFSATGPVAVILAVGTRGGLSESDLASWLFGCFLINGLITIIFCWLYRQPLGFFWTIPGTVLVGPALAHLSFPEVIGAYHVTGALLLILGLSGWVKRPMQALPMPIVMGMVAGVFMRFGLDLVRALHADVLIGAPMVGVFLLLSAAPALGRRMPPLIGALLVGVVAIVLLGKFDPGAAGGFALARPHLYEPVWSSQAMLELVLPLAITVLVVQNGQGFAVLESAGHKAPIDAVTVACGVGSMLAALVGSISTCLTGPTNAILTAHGERSRQYAGGITLGVLAILFGLLSPVFTRWLLAAPKSFIMALAGLAMLRVLQTAFNSAFRDRFTLGALVSFLVTISDLPILGIGAAFWGLLAGFGVSWVLERADFNAVRDA